MQIDGEHRNWELLNQMEVQKWENHMELNGGKFQQTMRGFHLAGFDGHGWVDG